MPSVQIFIQILSARKTLVVQPITKLMVRHVPSPWLLPAPPPQHHLRGRKQADAHTFFILSQGTDEHLSVATARPPVSTAPYNHLAEFLVMKESWVSLHSSSSCLGEELIVARKPVRGVCVCVCVLKN